MRDPCGDGNVLYLDHINVNILVVILYYSLGRYHRWGKCVKGTHRSSLYYSLQLHVNLQSSPNRS